jgi:arsenate reductase
VKEKKKILFVCVENARRSQMAEGFAEALGQGKIEVFSAGCRPSFQVDPLAIEVMKEKGIDLSARRPKGLNDLPPIEMDYLVTMGCEEACPAIPTKKVID